MDYLMVYYQTIYIMQKYDVIIYHMDLSEIKVRLDAQIHHLLLKSKLPAMAGGILHSETHILIKTHQY